MNAARFANASAMAFGKLSREALCDCGICNRITRVPSAIESLFGQFRCHECIAHVLNREHVPADEPYMRALSIRQPYAEMILRGVKTIEYRSRPTRLIGQRFYIYAARKWAGVNGHFVIPAQAGIQEATRRPLDSRLRGNDGTLPTGVIVGTAIISHCTNGGTPGSPFAYEWHLTDVQRLPKPRKPKGRPQPVWFKPF